MLTPDEIEAVMLGAQWVAGRSDKVLSNAARDVIAKIAAVVPERLRPFIVEPSVGVKPTIGEPEERIDPSSLRSAIRKGRKLRLRYRSEAGEETERTVWPVILGYAETSRLLVAWCELRQGFRHFRTDRMIEAEDARRDHRPAPRRIAPPLAALARGERSLSLARHPKPSCASACRSELQCGASPLGGADPSSPAQLAQMRNQPRGRWIKLSRARGVHGKAA